MAEELFNSPEASNHIKTLRRIGYDLNSAIADIVDNSVPLKPRNQN